MCLPYEFNLCLTKFNCKFYAQLNIINIMLLHFVQMFGLRIQALFYVTYIPSSESNRRARAHQTM